MYNNIISTQLPH